MMEATISSLFSRIGLILSWILVGLLVLAAPANAKNNVTPSLAFETLSPKAGSTVRVAIAFDAGPGWHTYWTNPGDSGAPPRVKWEAADGLTFSKLRHPAPKLLDMQGIGSYVHEGRHALLLDMIVPKGLAQGSPLPVTARLEWLACSDRQCVPESAVLQTMLVIGSGDTDFAGLSTIRQAEARMPGSLGNVSFTRDGSDWVFSVPGAKAGAALFPDDDDWFEPSASQIVSTSDGKTLIRVKALSANPPRSEFSGLLSSKGSSWKIAGAGRVDPVIPVKEALTSKEEPSVLNPEVEEPVTAIAALEPEIVEPAAVNQTLGAAAMIVSADGAVNNDEWLMPAIVAFFGAIAGGLLLNLMPCVFPILSLKALSLVKSGADKRSAREEGLGYTAGAVLTTTLFGAIIVGLKSVGVAAGWSFQLQNPVIVFALLIVVLLIALNLAGTFEMRLPLGFAGKDNQGWKGAFATGGLAAFVATPCSGPFMAGALGAVLILPPAAGLAVFAGLGLGMALPFLAISFIPALRNRLPRPGEWMVTLRKVLAVPMFLTALWLAWVLSRQTDETGLTIVAIAAALCVCGLVWTGRRQFSGRQAFPSLALASLAVAAVPLIGLPSPAPAVAAPSGNGLVQEFSVARLESLRKDGVPVFVDFTADWCLTCKVNEKAAINREQTRNAFKKAGVVTLVGDWTNGDPAITAFLEANGRNSIPFYLFYSASGEGEVLPQILTPELLIAKAAEAR